MAFGNGANPFASMHRDVLDASPDDEAGKAKLLEELRNRAKASISSKQHPAAELLYNKAIEVLPDATLYGNRSMVRLTLGKHAEALADAEEAIKADPTYAKAFFRKGQACTKLGKHSEAVDAYEKGAALEPTSKTWPSLATKAKDAMAKAVEEAAKEAAKPKQQKPVLKMPPVMPKGVKADSAAASALSSSGKKESEMRGYKVTADGRKTTFFNHDLDDEAKALIGDIRPKQISASDDVEGKPLVEGGSSWNTAGTWEERTFTPWGRDKLTELLVGVEFALPNGMGTLRTTKIKDITGDCSITMMRKKKKHLFDFAFTLEWTCKDFPQGPCKGSLKYPDVTPDCEGEYECSMEVDRSSPPAAREVLNEYVKRSGQGLQPAISAAIAKFVTEFNAIV